MSLYSFQEDTNTQTKVCQPTPQLTSNFQSMNLVNYKTNISSHFNNNHYYDIEEFVLNNDNGYDYDQNNLNDDDLFEIDDVDTCDYCSKSLPSLINDNYLSSDESDDDYYSDFDNNSNNLIDNTIIINNNNFLSPLLTPENFTSSKNQFLNNNNKRTLSFDSVFSDKINDNNNNSTKVAAENYNLWLSLK